jgi:hypothetical protein
VREETLERQKKMRIIPADTKLTPRSKEIVVVAVIHCSCLMLNEYLHGPRSIIEAFGTAHRTCPQCRAVHGERPVIVVRLTVPMRSPPHATGEALRVHARSHIARARADYELFSKMS